MHHSRLLLGEAQAQGGEHLNHLLAQCLGVVASPGHHDDKVVHIADESPGAKTLATTRAAAHAGGHHRLPGLGEMLVERRQGDVRQERREDAALRGAGGGLFLSAELGDDPSLEKRLDEREDALVLDPVAHTGQKCPVLDGVKAGLDVGLQHPLVGAGAEVVNLSYGLLCSSVGAKPVGRRQEVRLEDGFEHQLEGGLHYSVPHGGDTRATSLSRPRFGDQLLPYGLRPERAGLELATQIAKEGLDAPTSLDAVSGLTVDASSAGALVLPDPPPGQEQEGRVRDEVGKIIKPAALVLADPAVQLGLNLQYPGFRLFWARPRCTRAHGRPPGLSVLLLRTRCLPSPCGRLSRPRTTMQAPPPPAPSADDGPATTTWREGGAGGFPRSLSYRWTDEVPSYVPAASPHLRRSPSVWPPGRRHVNRPRSSPPRWVRAAPQPRSARFELVA